MAMERSSLLERRESACCGPTLNVEKQVAASMHNHCCNPARTVSSCVDSNFSHTAQTHRCVTFRASLSKAHALPEIAGSVVKAKRRLQRSAKDRSDKGRVRGILTYQQSVLRLPLANSPLPSREGTQACGGVHFRS